MPAGKNPKESAPHHTPDFFIDESGMKTGVRALCLMVLDYLKTGGSNTKSQKSF